LSDVRRGTAPLLASFAVLVFAGCVHEREKVVGIVPEGALAPPQARGRETTESSWSRRAFGRRGGRGAAVVEEDTETSRRAFGGGGASRADAEVFFTSAASRPPHEFAPATATTVPVAESHSDRAVPGPAVVRAAAPPAHRPIAATTSLEEVAREKFLVATTTVAAQRATLYVPAAYAAEVSLAGATVTDDAPGRRTATGSGVATLRRLTVRAGQVTVVVREGNPDVQLTARGDVSLRSDQPASLLDEAGLRGLFLKNDGYTPLR